MFTEIKKKYPFSTETIITNIFQQLKNVSGHTLFINFSEYSENYKKLLKIINIKHQCVSLTYLANIL